MAAHNSRIPLLQKPVQYSYKTDLCWIFFFFVTNKSGTGPLAHCIPRVSFSKLDLTFTGTKPIIAVNVVLLFHHGTIWTKSPMKPVFPVHVTKQEKLLQDDLTPFSRAWDDHSFIICTKRIEFSGFGTVGWVRTEWRACYLKCPG